MVKLKEIPRNANKKLCACRIPEKYLNELKKRKISFTDFVLQAFKETFKKKAGVQE